MKLVREKIEDINVVKLIFAHGPMGEFGKDDGLPWNCPTDLADFKEYTKGCTIVMGGATFASLPCKLPGRFHVVLGRPETAAKNGEVPDFILEANSDLKITCELLDDSTERDVCIIGGRDFICRGAHFVDEASITLIREVGEATHFIDPHYVGVVLEARLNRMDDGDRSHYRRFS